MMTKQDDMPTSGALRNIKQVLEETTSLPAMPEIPQRLLAISSDTNANLNDIIHIIETDPSLTAQILRYAGSPLFGFRGEITSLQQAISAVLGMRMTLDIALGLSLSKTFRVPADGPLGLYSLWRHGIYAAALCEHLARRSGVKPLPGLAFLAGLLHNIGFLVVGHLFSKEFMLLNQVVRANPGQLIIDIERRVLGIDHCEVGALLLSHWKLPAAVIVAAREHHQAGYDGELAPYAKLVCLANRLLQSLQIGDENAATAPLHLLSELQLDAEHTDQALQRIIDSQASLDPLARRFAA